MAEDPLAPVLAQLTEPTRALFQGARELIRSVHPEVVEVGWPVQKTAGFGVGPKKMSEQYIYFVGYPKHLVLGFYYGADLDDPHGLLTGSGKAMRSTRITSLADLRKPGLRELIERARHHLPKLG